MSYEHNVTIQGAEATLRIGYNKDNQVEYTLILSSKTAKIEVHGGLSLESKEEFNPAYVSEQIQKLGELSLREERKALVIDIMKYMYEHREAVARYETLLDTIIKKCYEMKTQVPDDREMTVACNRILTHFGKDLEEQKKAEAQEDKTERAVQKYREEQKRDHIYLRAVTKCQEEHREMVAKAANSYNASFSVEPRLKELYKLEEQRWEQEEERKKQEEVLKKQEQDRKTELVLQKYREEVKRDEPLVRAYLKDREEHLQLLQKVANTYRVPFAEKMYDQYLDWKVTYHGNAKNRYVRMCEFVESLPLFQ